MFAEVVGAILHRRSINDVARNTSRCFEAVSRGLKIGTHLDVETAAEEVEDLNVAISEAYARFRMWAGNMGAFQAAESSISLDYRLRDESDGKMRICDILEELANLLNYLSSGRALSSSVASSSHLGQELSETDELIAELLDFETSPSCSYAWVKAAISDLTSRLFKLSLKIEKSTTRDRYVRAEARYSHIFPDEFDVSHVHNMFGARSPCGPPNWLLDRLGKAITKRRMFLKYAREHQEKTIAGSDPASGRIDRSRSSATVLSQLGMKSINESKSLPAPSIQQTSASTLVKVDFITPDIGFDDEKSCVSEATSFSENRDVGRRKVVDLSEISAVGEPFQCPYCHKFQCLNGQLSWKKHVFADLRAYVCTFRECSLLMFKTKAAWLAHEMETHRRSWKCQLCSANPFASRDKLLTHLRGEHSKHDDNSIVALVDAGSTPLTQIPVRDCLLCDWKSTIVDRDPNTAQTTVWTVPYRKFMRHVACHLENLALFALPLECNDHDGSAASSNAAKAASTGASYQPSLSSEHSSRLQEEDDVSADEIPELLATCWEHLQSGTRHLLQNNGFWQKFILQTNFAFNTEWEHLSATAQAKSIEGLVIEIQVGDLLATEGVGSDSSTTTELLSREYAILGHFCQICQTIFRSEISLRDHKFKCHDLTTESILNLPIDGYHHLRYIHCPVPNCQDRFGTTHELFQHKLLKHRETKWQELSDGTIALLHALKSAYPPDSFPNGACASEGTRPSCQPWLGLGSTLEGLIRLPEPKSIPAQQPVKPGEYLGKYITRMQGQAQIVERPRSQVFNAQSSSPLRLPSIQQSLNEINDVDLSLYDAEALLASFNWSNVDFSDAAHCIKIRSVLKKFEKHLGLCLECETCWSKSYQSKRFCRLGNALRKIITREKIHRARLGGYSDEKCSFIANIPSCYEHIRSSMVSFGGLDPLPDLLDKAEKPKQPKIWEEDEMSSGNLQELKYIGTRSTTQASGQENALYSHRSGENEQLSLWEEVSSLGDPHEVLFGLGSQFNHSGDFDVHRNSNEEAGNGPESDSRLWYLSPLDVELLDAKYPGHRRRSRAPSPMQIAREQHFNPGELDTGSSFATDSGKGGTSKAAQFVSQP